jgi:hypothetical protein
MSDGELFRFVALFGCVVAAYFAGKATGFHEADKLFEGPRRELQAVLDAMRAKSGPDA